MSKSSVLGLWCWVLSLLVTYLKERPPTKEEGCTRGGVQGIGNDGCVNKRASKLEHSHKPSAWAAGAPATRTPWADVLEPVRQT